MAMGVVVKKRVELKVRNRLAMNAWMRSGAGVHKDHKQYAKTHGCDRDEWDDELQDYWQEKEDEPKDTK